MKAPEFSYARAASVDEALALFASAGGEARYLAGGQSLLAALNFRLDAPGLLIDLSRITGLSGVSLEPGHLRIGALTRHAAVARDLLVARHTPLISRAMEEVAHPAIRSRGTFGGSIALADPAAEMPACALALAARMQVTGPDGSRSVDADDWCHGTYETALEPGEILTAVDLSLPGRGARWGFAELARRKGDYAMAGVAVSIPASTGSRIVFFGVSDRAVRSPAAEAALDSGCPATEAAELAAEDLDIFGDLNASEAVKRHYMRVLLARALSDLREIP